MTPRVKVGGITRLEDARFAAAAGADYLGFVQDPASPRHLPAAHAREIVEWVVGPEPVGVFAGAPPAEVIATCRAAGFRLAQLDGHESPAECAEIEAAGIPVVKTFALRHDASAEQVRALVAPYAGAARHVRLDTTATALWGGDGESLDHRLVRALATETSLFLAGDVTAAHVADALRMRPFALDVSGSVEEAPGVLDFDRLGALLDALHTA